MPTRRRGRSFFGIVWTYFRSTARDVQLSNSPITCEDSAEFARSRQHPPARGLRGARLFTERYGICILMDSVNNQSTELLVQYAGVQAKTRNLVKEEQIVQSKKTTLKSLLLLNPIRF